MTQEEKAKAYDEALEAARKELKQDLHESGVCAIQRIFPELRESEDERIRRTLVEYFGPGAQLDFIRGVPIQKIRDWLEKQKECVADSSKTSAEEDESIRKFLVDYFTSYKIGNVATKLNGVRIDDILNYLEKQKELPFVKDVVLGLPGLYFYDGERMHFQGTPAIEEEWSEEDEEMLNSCISSIEEAKENRYAYKETDGDTSYDHEIAWLKSIRPSWKPSEHQMSMLLAVVNDPNNAGSESCHLSLKLLYNELKKL